jgi:hypothetical protein
LEDLNIPDDDVSSEQTSAFHQTIPSLNKRLINTNSMPIASPHIGLKNSLIQIK